MSKEISGDRCDRDSLEVMNKSSSSKASEKRPSSSFSSFGIFDGSEDIADTCHQEELRLLAHTGALDDLYEDIVSPPLFQACGEDIRMLSSFKSQDLQFTEQNYEKSHVFPSKSLAILKHCSSRIGMENSKKIHIGPRYDAKQKPDYHSPLSTTHIIELAAGNFIQTSSGTTNELSAISHPYASSLLGLSTANDENIQLIQDLLSCAEKIGHHKYESARELLEEIHQLSFGKTNTIQRLVYHFTEALMEKIDRKTGSSVEKNRIDKWLSEYQIPCRATIAFFEKIPLIQITQFTHIQSIADHLSASRKVHIIDLEIRCGIQEIILMQTLAGRSECPLESLKITAVATNSKDVAEETGVRLKNLADSLNLNFSYHVIMLEDILNLHQNNLFDLDDKEAVIVHSAYGLRAMISKPSQLETLMRVIRNIKPLVMIITETEANVNSPIFVNRFVEALFFYGAYFDCMEECLKNNISDRTYAESMLFGPAIRNIMAAEGEERKCRIVGINVWRAFFSRFGMVETELSKLALHHANLVRKSFDCGDSCTLDLNGNCLIIGWKGTPVCSLSAWKFHRLLPVRRFRS